MRGIVIGEGPNALDLDNSNRKLSPRFEAHVVREAKNIHPDSFLGQLARQKTFTELKLFILRCVCVGIE
jgi:hypothetical protein